MSDELLSFKLIVALGVYDELVYEEANILLLTITQFFDSEFVLEYDFVAFCPLLDDVLTLLNSFVLLVGLYLP